MSTTTVTSNSHFNVAFKRASDRPSARDQQQQQQPKQAPGDDKSATPADALTCAFSYDTDLLCVGTSKGHIKLLHAASNYKPASFELSSALCRGAAMNSTISCVRFRPGPNRSTKDLLLVASTDGTLSEWHLGSVQMVFADTVTQDDPDDMFPNELYACDYEPSTGDFFCSTGKNGRLKIYDSNRKANISTLRYTALADTCDAHSSRVQAVRWSPTDKNIIYSGGWDKTVQQWDFRAGRATNRIFGPYICGDGLDVHGNLIVTASTRPSNQLQFWDARNFLKPLCEFSYPIAPSTLKDPEPAATSLFAAKFSPNGHYLATGGSVDYRVIDVRQTLHDKVLVSKVKNESAADDAPESEKTIPVYKPVECGRILQDGGVNAAVFSVAWRDDSTTAAVGYGTSISVLNRLG